MINLEHFFHDWNSSNRKERERFLKFLMLMPKIWEDNSWIFDFISSDNRENMIFNKEFFDDLPEILQEKIKIKLRNSHQNSERKIVSAILSTRMNNVRQNTMDEIEGMFCNLKEKKHILLEKINDAIHSIHGNTHIVVDDGSSIVIDIFISSPFSLLMLKATYQFEIDKEWVSCYLKKEEFFDS